MADYSKTNAKSKTPFHPVTVSSNSSTGSNAILRMRTGTSSWCPTMLIVSMHQSSSTTSSETRLSLGAVCAKSSQDSATPWNHSDATIKDLTGWTIWGGVSDCSIAKVTTLFKTLLISRRLSAELQIIVNCIPPILSPSFKVPAISIWVDEKVSIKDYNLKSVIHYQMTRILRVCQSYWYAQQY